jgi:hypothetical protein
LVISLWAARSTSPRHQNRHQIGFEGFEALGLAIFNDWLTILLILAAVVEVAFLSQFSPFRRGRRLNKV